jgi:hypothetical protein
MPAITRPMRPPRGRVHRLRHVHRDVTHECGGTLAPTSPRSACLRGQFPSNARDTATGRSLRKHPLHVRTCHRVRVQPLQTPTPTRVRPIRMRTGINQPVPVLRPSTQVTPLLTGLRPHPADHNDPQAELRGIQRRGEPGDAGTDDYEVRARLPFPPGAAARAGYRAHSAPPGRPISIIRWTAARARVASTSSTCTSSVPCRSDRNNVSGVIIFM